MPKDGIFERERLRYHPEVIEILHATVGDTERDDRLHLLGDDGFGWVGAQDRGRPIEKNRVYNLDGLGRDRVAEPDIDLDGYARAPAMVAFVLTHTSAYSVSSRIGEASMPATSKTTPSSGTAIEQMERMLAAIVAGSVSPLPRRSRSRVGRKGSSRQMAKSIAPLSTNRSRRSETLRR